MPTTIKSIWIEAEHWASGEWNPRDENSAVRVELSDGTAWVATFFTYQNIESLRLKKAATGECLSGKYFWATDLVLIDELTRARVEEVVAHMLAEQEFSSAFAPAGRADHTEDGSADGHRMTEPEADESLRASSLLGGRVVKRVVAHSPKSVMLEFTDGTRLFVNSGSSVELSIT